MVDGEKNFYQQNLSAMNLPVIRLYKERVVNFSVNDEPSASAAIRTLYELYAQDIYRYAWFNLGNVMQAEDVVQEVYLRALRFMGGIS